MITEDYVSFETAKLLKEKGFDERCVCYYNTESLNKFGHPVFDSIDMSLSNSDLEKSDHDYVCYSAPTLQMAMKWLREVYNCHICVQALITTDGLQGYCPFCTKVGGVFMWQNVLGDDYATTQTYEEACESAIKYCLENLI